MNILVTGGAGFIGSHLVDSLSKENNVTVYDNFSYGKLENLDGINCKIIRADILDKKEIKAALTNIDICFHFAANPDIKNSYFIPIENFKVNFEGTLNVLEACRINDVPKFIFSSSSVVYGESELPTPEEAQIKPISNYGAAKASSEAYMMSYSNLYDIKCLTLRYANVIGPKLTHGIIFDFYNKLKQNPNELEIYGDGTQEKSYLHVLDCINATILISKKMNRNFNNFNVGSEKQICVNEIADLIVIELGLKNVKYKYRGGTKGWPGDVPKMLLSIEKLKKYNWKPIYTINRSIIDTINYLRNNT